MSVCVCRDLPMRTVFHSFYLSYHLCLYTKGSLSPRCDNPSNGKVCVSHSMSEQDCELPALRLLALLTRPDYITNHLRASTLHLGKYSDFLKIIYISYEL